MGFFSRFRSRRSATIEEEDPDEAPSLLRYRYEDPSRADIERAAAADVEAVEQDDKYFGGQAPGDPEHPRHPEHPERPERER
jgi:hypothetical protein